MLCENLFLLNVVLAVKFYSPIRLGSSFRKMKPCKACNYGHGRSLQHITSSNSNTTWAEDKRLPTLQMKDTWAWKSSTMKRLQSAVWTCCNGHNTVSTQFQHSLHRGSPQTLNPRATNHRDLTRSKPTAEPLHASGFANGKPVLGNATWWNLEIQWLRQDR